ncbi:hypothetical protein ATO6_17065 [Oceanicola sp. 22II-s10i]|uniref:LpxI family protein n=1 Tax=Oceanicola sp. 22II-s10i TaxID=1317116 RepID=UPI000B52024E|nr:UDP-2,3-diacylglucosamine diphosphatase LpxI [Oceanicola sp. 22II-s10i]OWU83581.1 hypothetical protein ATO6_17065 [Oceanicola sp. 22II-s10i]
MARIGLIAFGGRLPVEVAASAEVHVVTFAGVETLLTPTSGTAHRFETLGRVVSELRSVGTERIVLAGSLKRPALDQTAFDSETRALATALSVAVKRGDDAVMRLVIGFFEGQGLEVLGAHEVAPHLVAEPGLVAGPAPADGHRADADRAEAILGALGPLDVGQAAVVAGGRCLGIETVQGTDAMLRQVAETPAHHRPDAAGVLVKWAKDGQDLRADMPAIGPVTVDLAARAGLAGIVVEAGRVLILDRAAVVAAAEDAGLFVLARGE